MAARRAALHLLSQVLDQARPLDESLDGSTELAELAGRDRAFARNLTATTLRRLGQIDRIIAGCLETPLPPRATGARHLLRLGICQLLFLATPPHAAVDTALRLLDERGSEAGHKGLLNAVLRRIDRERTAWLANLAEPSLNAPPWLWQSWVEAYGPETAAAIARAHMQEAPLDITVKGDSGRWAMELNAALLPIGGLRRAAGGRIEELPGYADGAWWVQDAAAAIPARLLGQVAGKRVIDLCAAPGGKTAQLAAAGALVTAVDRSEGRLRRMRANLQRLALPADIIVADAKSWRPAAAADAVLLDAPCTATGTIRRHPDIAWLKTADDVRRLAEVQAVLLRAAVAMARPGGMIVYCSCSLQPEEGAAQIARLLGEGAPARRRPIDAVEFGGRNELLSADGDLRTLPCHLAELGGIDGFYAARLERTG